MRQVDDHAIDRYIERWRPSVSREQARDELRMLDRISIPLCGEAIRAARLGDRFARLVYKDDRIHTVMPDDMESCPRCADRWNALMHGKKGA
jgi:hypothetical protein